MVVLHPDLRRLDDRSLDQIEALGKVARDEGYRFVDRLLDEWRAGRACFTGPGEQFLGAFDENSLLAFGGLHRDPYLNEQRVGRLRRLYVAPGWRRGGVASALAAVLIEAARGHFDLIRLRTPDAAADRFYEALGFERTGAADATQVMRLC